MINIETVEKNGQFCRRLSSAETAAPRRAGEAGD